MTNPERRQEASQTEGDINSRIDSLLETSKATSKASARDGHGLPAAQSETTLAFMDRMRAQERTQAYRKDFQQQQEKDRGSRQGKIFRSMRFPSSGMVPRESTVFETREATRATATIKSRPSLGRTVEVIPDRGMDLGRALKSLDVNCAVNNVRKDANKQRYYERPGSKRKRLHRTRSPVTSPISPKSQGRPRPRGPPNFESRSSDSHSFQQHSQLQKRPDVAASPSASSPGIQTQGRNSTRTTRASTDSKASRTSSNASPIAKRALRALKAPASIKVPSASRASPPVRPARSGFAWSGQISGRRYEIRVGKSPETDTASPAVKASDNQPAPFPTRESSTCTTTRVTPTRVTPIPIIRRHRSQHLPMDKSSDSSPDERPRKSLVDRTKRLLGIKSMATSPSPVPARPGPHSPTTQSLNHAASALRELSDKQKRSPPSGSTSTSNLSAISIAGRPKHSRGKLRPGYRRRHTGHSSSSSILRLTLGKPPVGTPNSDCMYTGSDEQQYFRVELTEPGAPTYLPSEARRIGTPPLPQNGSKLRGFFFDYNAPQSVEEQASSGWPNAPMDTIVLHNRQQGHLPHSSQPTTAARSPGARLKREDMNVEWFRIKAAVDEVREERDDFELNVPEHLPSSPLCPRHPKHKSGGKGVCVYHGRTKTGANDEVVEGGFDWR
ncbi:MAG: hypothetical protein Q9177_004018 [Variospora cf. flavescens]